MARDLGLRHERGVLDRRLPGPRRTADRLRGGHASRRRRRASMMDPGFWRGRRVLLTGHTGFKGAWLALWLHELGAAVTGFSGPPPSAPSLFDAAGGGERLGDPRGGQRADAGAPAGAGGGFPPAPP